MANSAFNATGISDFDAVRLAVASPEDILKWSYGEVLKPETINYRTQKPERDGLFCERIFGPVKDINPHDSKLKGVRSREAAVDKNGELVTKSIVRRERMGHIQLAVPVAHIWFMRGTPSAMSQLLGMTVRNIEKIVYFATYVILNVDEATRDQYLADLEAETDLARKAIKIRYEKMAEEDGADVKQLAKEQSREVEELEEAYVGKKSQLESLNFGALISESEYRNLPEEYDELIEVGMGASAVKELLDKIELPKLIAELTEEVETAKGQRQKKLLKRLKMLESMESAGIKPSSLCMTVLPVIPPDLRPMVALSGGRFATSDLNDLYRRIINRNNRLKKLIELNAPEVIQRNEKRMLQEAVDALIDNSASRGRAVSSTGGRRSLKSLSDMLKGKQGRFRQNLLGKRVDYSGRSVIVVGPKLKINQCGLPKQMALELFKPFVISWLIKNEFAHNIRSASRLIEAGEAVVWDALDSAIEGKYVLLNRAPSLHRLSIQAFQPVLVEGKAIQLHPLVCAGFNADFDGDQMAVHLPLSKEAQAEARELMSATANLLKPADGAPVLHISQDIVLGNYYLTYDKPQAQTDKVKTYSSVYEAEMAYDNGVIHLQTPIRIFAKGKMRETTLGRVFFNEILPEDFPYDNNVQTKKQLKKVLAQIFNKYGAEETAKIADRMKGQAFRFATVAAVSTGMTDYVHFEEIPQFVAEGDAKAALISEQFDQGLITEEERYNLTVSAWRNVDNKITAFLKDQLAHMDTSISMMVNSGARGDISNVKLASAMIGVQMDATNHEIELPIRSSYTGGLSSLEAFIATRGARKGLIDTALKTADSGYLTRRLVDVAQDVIIREDDCGTDRGLVIRAITDGKEMIEPLEERLTGRYTKKSVKHPETGEVIVGPDTLISEDLAREIVKAGVEEVTIRSVFTCNTRHGVCRHCYGINLATGDAVEVGEAVGTIAAQSIGEPGTQLTMRTFHTGGVASNTDITQGLPRVQEIFEARNPKGEAVITEVKGEVTAIEEDASTRTKKVFVSGATGEGEYVVPYTARMKVEVGDQVSRGAALTEGSIQPKRLLAVRDVLSVETYLLAEVQKVYRSQGVEIGDKHIEVMVRQMIRKVRVMDPGDTDLLMGTLMDITDFTDANKDVLISGGVPATARPVLMGITKASLETNSFLSAASFQETTRVLTDAAIRGKKDHLLGLKENVIIGKIIPAGTGMARYRNLEPQAVNEVEIIEEVPLTDGTVDEVQTAEVVEE